MRAVAGRFNFVPGWGSSVHAAERISDHISPDSRFFSIGSDRAIPREYRIRRSMQQKRLDGVEER